MPGRGQAHAPTLQRSCLRHRPFAYRVGAWACPRPGNQHPLVGGTRSINQFAVFSILVYNQDEMATNQDEMTTAKKDISSGTVHEVPADLREALTSDPQALAAWEDLTPLARNEWICWTISVKKPETRTQHVERVRSELKEGIRRPCCWMGCIHRTDKTISPSVQYVLNKRSKKSS